MTGKEKRDKLRIVRVNSFHDGSLEFVLSNGNYFVVEAKYILELPGFEALAEDEYLSEPIVEEAGDAIYWQDGPRRVGVEELLTLIGKAGGE